MSRESSLLIDRLVADLVPVPPLTRNGGLLRVGLAAVATVAGTLLAFGIRPQLGTGPDLHGTGVDPVFLLASGLFLVLAYAALYGVIQTSRPRVGNRQSGWLWASAMVALLPVGALVTLALARGGHGEAVLDSDGWQCLGAGVLAGLLTGAMLVAWLRRGAPTSPGRAGLMTGIASGSVGIFAFGLSCPHDSLAHIGLWHGGAVLASALLGRLAVPPLIRW